MKMLRNWNKKQHITFYYATFYYACTLKATLMWSLLLNPSAHSSAWMLNPTCTSCFHGWFMLDLQTRKVSRLAIFKQSFRHFLSGNALNLELTTPPMPVEFQTAFTPLPPPHTHTHMHTHASPRTPPLSLRIPRCHPWYGMDILWNHPIYKTINQISREKSIARKEGEKKYQKKTNAKEKKETETEKHSHVFLLLFATYIWSL